MKVVARIEGRSVEIDLDRVARRFIQDLLQQATVDYWERRARQLDTIGTAWGDETAQACRNHAEGIRRGWWNGWPE